MTVISHSKKCFKCNEVKLLDEFYKHPNMVDGYLNKCKRCAKLDTSSYYKNNRKHYAKYEQKRFKNPNRKTKIKKYQQDRRKNNPEKYKCGYLTSNAIRDKRIFKKPCQVCGNINVEAHHKDYAKPFDIEWLCRKHHLQKHGKKAYEQTLTF